MKFIEALALVVSKRSRSEHGARYSWLESNLKRHNEAIAKYEASNNEFGVEASDEVALTNRSSEVIESAYSAEYSPLNLNNEFAAFMEQNGGRR